MKSNDRVLHKIGQQTLKIEMKQKSTLWKMSSTNQLQLTRDKWNERECNAHCSAIENECIFHYHIRCDAVTIFSIDWFCWGQSNGNENIHTYNSNNNNQYV